MRKAIAIIILLLLYGTFCISAQETVRERLNRNNSVLPDSARAYLWMHAPRKNRIRSDVSDAKWLREIYRYLDLSKEKNAPLYYPVTPEEGRVNLFTLIFKLLAEGKIKAYEYLDGKERFTDEYRIDFKEFVDRFGIFYEWKNGKIVVNDIDIPGNEVLGYYVKEAYYFQTATSNYGVRTVAVCPVIHRQGDYEANTVRYPLFWVPYDEIRPYALRMPIMMSGLNNSMAGTIDDFFCKRNYDGEIYKAVNPRNLAISQYASTPEEIKREQERIEKELRNFEEKLWKKETDSLSVQRPLQKFKTKKKSAKATSSTASNTMRDRRY